MQADGDLGKQPSSIPRQAGTDARPIPNEAPRTRKITVQLSESTFQRLVAATDRPGPGRSMVVETALERFLDPAPPIESVIHEALHRVSSQIERLESEIAIIAETVLLHARYHLTVTPPMSRSQQREACALGHERFTAFAEQVDRRIRLGRRLMRETIDRLNSTDPTGSVAEADHDASLDSAQTQLDQGTRPIAIVDETSTPVAAAEEGGSNLNFRHLPNAFC